MSWFPDTRLVRAAGLWSLAALFVVVWPWLWALLAGVAAVLVGLAVWDARLLARLPPLAVARELPERAFLNREAAISIVMRNHADLPVVVDVVDELPVDLAPSDPQFSGEPVPPHDEVRLRYAVRPERRGDRKLGTLVTLLRSPLGFWRRRGTLDAADVLRVYPDTGHFLRPEGLDARRMFAAIGVKPAPRRGTGMEFESLRDYVPGDDPRGVDWAASARRGRAVTRLYQHEHNHRVIVAIDTSRLMAAHTGTRTKLDCAIDAALALTYAALMSGDRVGMTVFDRAVHGHLAPRGQRRDLGMFIDLLRPLQPRLVEADYGALVRNLAVRQRQRALIVIVTDFVEADSATVTEPLTVLARRHRVLLVAIRDHLYDALEPGAPAAAEDGLTLYRRLVLNELLEEREAALARLRRAGIQTLDLVPERVTAAVLNRYLAIRYGPER